MRIALSPLRFLINTPTTSLPLPASHHTHTPMTVSEQDEQTSAFLSRLFGEQTLRLTRRLDVADLHINDAMTQSIGASVSELKRLKGDVSGQKAYIAGLEEGARLLLCLWVTDMALHERLR